MATDKSNCVLSVEWCGKKKAAKHLEKTVSQNLSQESLYRFSSLHFPENIHTDCSSVQGGLKLKQYKSYYSSKARRF